MAGERGRFVARWQGWQSLLGMGIVLGVWLRGLPSVSAAPRVEPVSTPSAAPRVEPGATPSASSVPRVDPTATPSAAPRAEPTATPNVTPRVPSAPKPASAPAPLPRTTLLSARGQEPGRTTLALGARLMAQRSPEWRSLPLATFRLARHLTPGIDGKASFESIGIFSTASLGLRVKLPGKGPHAFALNADVLGMNAVFLTDGTTGFLWGVSGGGAWSHRFFKEKISVTASFDVPVTFPKFSRTRIEGTPRRHASFVTALQPGLAVEVPTYGSLITVLETDVTLILGGRYVSQVAPRVGLAIAW